MENERLFRAAFEASPVGLQILRRKSATVSAFETIAENRAASDAIGPAHERVLTVASDQDPDAFSKLLGGVLDTGSPASWELDAAAVGEPSRYFRGTAQRIDPDTVILAFESITQERVVRRERTIYRKLFELSPVAKLVLRAKLDPVGPFTLVAANRLGLQLTEPGDAKALRQPLPSVMPRWRDTEVPSMLSRVFEEQTAMECEVATAADGSAHAVQVVRAYPISTQEIGINVEDITERRRLEEDLARALTEARRSNAELEQFAYVASHDLQEPLRMVATYTALLAKRFPSHVDEKAKKYIGYAVEGAKRMQQLIDDLLAYSRIDRKTSRDRAPLQSALEQAKLLLAGAIRKSRASITSDELPIVTGDASQLTSLFQNLLGNAIKFRRPGSRPTIRITAQQEDGTVTIRVCDDGIGIPPDQHQRVFRMFQRLHSRDDYEGTGIGLAMCKKIVGRHGGTIWIESSPDELTTIAFTIPLPASDREKS